MRRLSSNHDRSCLTFAILLAIIAAGSLSLPRSASGQTTSTPPPSSSTSSTPSQQPAPEPLNDSAVEAGKKALSSVNDFPWYDSSKDDLQRVNIRPEKPVKQRNYDGPDWDFSWLTTAFESIGVLLKVLIYLALFAILAVIAYFIVRAFLGRDQKDGENDAASDEEEETSGGIDRVEELPVQLAAPRGDFLSEARRRYEAGDYSGAIIYLFSHQLLQLDRHQRIQLTRGKTNRQYLREIRNEPRLQEMLSRTMFAFEDVFFGRRKLERERFEECWREVDEFHRLTPQGGAA
ncbi:MAG: DUF4129 domain-containing protein [Pirellulales bacterium]